jgi:predicted DNA-binding protein YlxM (UPF0122 family)
MKQKTKKETEARNLLKDHYTITEFSKLKEVSRRAIYDAIESGKIKPDIVGNEKLLMIDAKKYKKISFAPQSGPRIRKSVNQNHTTNAKKQLKKPKAAAAG